MSLIPEVKLGIPAGLREKSGNVVIVKMQCDGVGRGPAMVLGAGWGWEAWETGLVLERSCYLWAVSHLHFLWPQAFTNSWAFQVETEGKKIVFILTNYRHSHLYVGVKWVSHQKLRGKEDRPQPLIQS